jgi:hypothetical protein
VQRRIIRKRVIMAAANFKPGGSKPPRQMMVTSELKRSWVHRHSIILRALCQHAPQIIDKAVGPEEEGKLAHGRLLPTSHQCTPRRAGRPSRLMEPRAVCSA